MNTDLFLFAGETSGDLLGAALISALKQTQPNLSIEAVAGPSMRAHNIHCLLPMEEFQVMGFIDVFFALGKLIRLFHKVKNHILKTKPKILVLIDYPGFNLRLATALRKRGFKGKIVHYVCPSIWAWKKQRIIPLVQNLDLLLTILPFEISYFAHTSLPVCYVGNPIAERVESWKTPAPASIRRNYIALFPGSRRKEIERNLPLQLRTAKYLLQKHPSYSCVISVVDARLEPLIRSLVDKEKIPLPLLITPEEFPQYAQHITLALAKSGTITLELALCDIPTVVMYKMTMIDLFLAKHVFKIKLPYYSLPNIIVGQEIFPELIGHQLTEHALRAAAEKLLTDTKSRTLCLSGCSTLKDTLGNQKPSREASKQILQLAQKPPSA